MCHIQNVKLTGHYRAVEESLNANIDYKDMILRVFESLKPFMLADVAANDMEKLLDKFAPVAFMKMAEIMISGRNERNQLTAATALVDRAGYRPIERSINLEGDISKLTGEQLNSYLKNAWQRLPAEDKNKVIQLVQAPDGTMRVPEGDELPTTLPEDIEVTEIE